MIQSWENAWEEFVPFLAFPVELRKIVYTTNAVESLNARFRRAVRHRGHFPNEQAAMKVLYLVATTRRQNRENMTGRIHNWKQILNALVSCWFNSFAVRVGGGHACSYCCFGRVDRRRARCVGGLDAAPDERSGAGVAGPYRADGRRGVVV